MLAQQRGRWANINPALGQRVVFAGYARHKKCFYIIYLVFATKKLSNKCVFCNL